VLELLRDFTKSPGRLPSHLLDQIVGPILSPMLDIRIQGTHHPGVITRHTKMRASLVQVLSGYVLVLNLATHHLGQDGGDL